MLNNTESGACCLTVLLKDERYMVSEKERKLSAVEAGTIRPTFAAKGTQCSLWTQEIDGRPIELWLKHRCILN